MATISIDFDQIVTAETQAAQTQAALLAGYEAAIQLHIDNAAQARRYRDGFALAGYVTSTVPAFAAEAKAFVAWRDAVWVYAYAELDKVAAALRLPPETPQAFIGELPAIEWPGNDVGPV